MDWTARGCIRAITTVLPEGTWDGCDHTEGKVEMKNIHTRLLFLIIVLLSAALWAILTKPMRLGLDIQGGIRVVLRAKAEELKAKQLEKSQLDTITSIMRHRVDALGVAEPVVYPKPPEQIVVELPGLTNKEQAL